jgi:hypothetical protein
LHSAPALEAKITVDVNEAVVAHVTYKNVSSGVVWIKRGLYGIGDGNLDKIYNGSVDEFNLKLIDGRSLKFNGFIVDFVGPDTTKRDFVIMQPGEVVAVYINLGPIKIGPLKGKYLYHFLPGTHEYEISARYMIFDEKGNTIKTFLTEPTTFTLTLPEKKP